MNTPAICLAVILTAAIAVRAEPYTLTTIAGRPGLQSVDGTNQSALFSYPNSVAYGPGGDIYVADGWSWKVHRLRQAGTNWISTTLAGGSPGVADGINTNAQFRSLYGIAVDHLTNVYVSDGNAIRRIRPQGDDWVVSGFAGSVQVSGSSDGSVGRFNMPIGLTVDSAGNLYVADSGNHSIRKVTPSGYTTTIAGPTGSPTPNPGSADGIGSSARFRNPSAVTLVHGTNLFVADTGNHTIRKVSLSGSSWVVTTIAGSVLNPGILDGTNTTALFNTPSGIAAEAGERLFVVDAPSHTLRRLDPIGGAWVVTTVAGAAGLPGSMDATNSAARFNYPAGLASDSAARLFVADRDGASIRQVTLQDTNAIVTTMAGDSKARQKDGPGDRARFWQPKGLAVGESGEIYVADKNNHVIRQLTYSVDGWDVTTIAGTPGIRGSTDGTNASILFSFPCGIAIGPDGTVFVSDTDNCTIRQLMKSGTNWVSTTIAGTAGAWGLTDGTNAAARFVNPTHLVWNSRGELFVSEANRIRLLTRIDTDWVVTTVPGFLSVDGLATDADNNLYVSDANANSIRKVVRTDNTWSVTTIAGPAGLMDGTNSTARFNQPSGLTVNSNGVIFVLDRLNNCLRKITPEGTNWVVSTLAGLAPQKGLVDGNGPEALLNWPSGLAIGTLGTLYISDTGNDTIRLAWPAPVLSVEMAPGEATLSWPLTLGAYVPETTDSVKPGAAWMPVEQQAATNGTVVKLTVPVQSSQRFYRLRLRADGVSH